jgi:hypothetical protein
VLRAATANAFVFPRERRKRLDGGEEILRSPIGRLEKLEA